MTEWCCFQFSVAPFSCNTNVDVPTFESTHIICCSFIRIIQKWQLICVFVMIIAWLKYNLQSSTNGRQKRWTKTCRLFDFLLFCKLPHPALLSQPYSYKASVCSAFALSGLTKGSRHLNTAGTAAAAEPCVCWHESAFSQRLACHN